MIDRWMDMIESFFHVTKFVKGKIEISHVYLPEFNFVIREPCNLLLIPIYVTGGGGLGGKVPTPLRFRGLLSDMDTL